LIDEEYDNHKCSPKINGKIQIIEVDYWIRGKHPKTGEDLISTKALDGTTYWIVKRIPKLSDKVPLSLSLPTESQQLSDQQRKETPDKDDSTIIIIILRIFHIHLQYELKCYHSGLGGFERKTFTI